MKNILLGLASLLLLVCACTRKPDTTTEYSLLPIPQSMHIADGSFTIGKGTKLYIDAPADDRHAISNAFAAWDDIAVTDKNTATNCISMTVCDTIEGLSSPEGYTINVGKDKITVKATSGAGLFYAAQTLQQLANGGNSIPV